jgi:predicted phosphohydrolase
MNTKMRLVVLADTHGFHRQLSIPDGDFLIHAGDFCLRGELSEVEDFNEFLGTLPHRHKLVIAGNHDVCLETQPAESRRRLTNAIYLQDQAAVLEEIKFYGSPWQPEFREWAFNLPRGGPLREKWDQIPSDTDVLLTHGPPRGILDLTVLGEHAGDDELQRAVKRIRPKGHLFGHIHEGSGVLKRDGTTFVNASICDAMDQPVNLPAVITISKGAAATRGKAGAG